MSEEFRMMGFRELEKFYEENGFYADQDPRNPMNFFDTDTPERRLERINKVLEERKAIDVKEDTGGLLDALPMSREEGMKRRKEIEDEDINKAIEKGTMTRAAKGGSMSKQMELFDEGGLKDEGGTVDPVSGNEVPPGSTQEEVRDDIPAQLSEGEFVFPADVVRYLGLEFLMNLRQRAKAGLKKMEEMGQMGNSDEATLPDDIPFTVDDLEMAEGGVVEAQAGTYVAPSIPVGRVDLQNQTQQMMPPQTQQINTPGVRTVGMAQPFRATSEPYAPTSYQQFLGPSARGAPETETRVYKHPDGRIRNILVVKATGLPVIPGAIEDAIKDGFVFEPQPLKEEVKVEPIKQQTSKVESVSGDGGDNQEPIISSTDPTGIAYNKSTLQSEELKSLFDNVSVLEGLGMLNPYVNVTRSMFGKGNVAAASNAAIGGILDGFRGGDVNYYGTNTRNTGLQSGTYENNKSLNDLSKYEQKEIGQIGNVVFSTVIEPMIYDTDAKGNKTARSDANIKASAISKAKELGLITTIPNTNITLRTETILRSIAKKEYEIRAQKLEQEIDKALSDVGKDPTIKENIARQEAAEKQARQDFGGSDDYDYSSGFGETGDPSEGVEQTGVGYTDPSTGLGVGATGGFFTKSKMTKQKPKSKKMKRGGLASKK